MSEHTYTLGIDIGSTTVKIAVLDENDNLLFSDYQRHYAEIQSTAGRLIREAYEKLGDLKVSPPRFRDAARRQTSRSSSAVRTPRSFILKMETSSSG